MATKPELIEHVLDRYGIQYNPTRNGWQPIHCPNQAGHLHGDTNPSCSLNLQHGLIKCHACDLVGDAYNVIMRIENTDFIGAKARIGGVTEHIESDWII